MSTTTDPIEAASATPQTESVPEEQFDVVAIQAEVEATDVGGYAQDDDERILLRYLRRRQQVVAEITHIEEQTKAILRSLANQVKGLDFVYDGLARDIAQRKLAGKKAKSIKTPFGTVGFRTQRGRLVVVDEQKCLEAAPEECIRCKPEISMTKLNEYHERTGEILPGTEMTADVEKFYVK